MASATDWAAWNAHAESPRWFDGYKARHLTPHQEPRQEPKPGPDPVREHYLANYHPQREVARDDTAQQEAEAGT